MTPFVWQSNNTVLFYFTQNSVSEIRFITSARRGGAFGFSKEECGFHSVGDGWHLEVLSSGGMGPGPGFWLLFGEWVEAERGEARNPVGRWDGCPGEEGCRFRLRRGEGNWTGKVRVDGACRRLVVRMEGRRNQWDLHISDNWVIGNKESEGKRAMSRNYDCCLEQQ